MGGLGGDVYVCIEDAGMRGGGGSADGDGDGDG